MIISDFVRFGLVLVICFCRSAAMQERHCFSAVNWIACC